jgi:Ferritin-like domain
MGNALADGKECAGMTGRLSRSSLLRQGVAGGGTLLLSGSAVSVLAGAASAATVPDSDLAYLRLLVGTELLAADFQTQALSSGKLAAPATALVKQLLADENAHYTGLATLIAAAGQVPATADDINFAYPKGTFDSQVAIMKLAATLENLTLGAYLGAVENVQTPQLRLPIGQIAANEAQHVGALALAAGKPPIGRAFAPSLQIDAVSSALDAYES